MTAAARADAILKRFPTYLRAGESGKLLGFVAGSLAGELEQQTGAVGRVRRAHRVGQADTHGDLLGHAALHDLRARDFEILALRLAALAGLRAELAGAGDDAAIDAALARLDALLRLPSDSFAPTAEEGDDRGPAIERLLAALDGAMAYRGELGLLRAQLLETVAVHRLGNGSPASLMRGAASALGLGVESIQRLENGFWYLARCRDRLRLAPIEPGQDYVVLEENPPELESAAPAPRRHAQRFSITRKGFVDAPLTLRVIGIGERTVHPMVVDLDSGIGVAYRGLVGDGQELRFELDGRVLLDGEDVAQRAYGFAGGVFADTTAPHAKDFRFAEAGAEEPAGRDAVFAVTRPHDDRFEPDAAWPHEGGEVETPTIAVGESRWALFMRVAHYGREVAVEQAGEDGPEVVGSEAEPAVPIFDAGVFEESVWAEGNGAGPDESAELGFEWLERQPYAVRLWIPGRFESLDSEDAVPVRERVRMALDRYRAAGIRVAVRYASDLWTLGEGLLRDPESDQALGLVIQGTGLWPAGTEQPVDS